MYAALLTSGVFATRDNSFGVKQWDSPLPQPARLAPGVTPSSLVWPPPHHLVISGDPVRLDAEFKITTSASGKAGLTRAQGAILRSTVARFGATLDTKRALASAPAVRVAIAAVHTLTIEVDATIATPDVVSLETKYGYTLSYTGDGVVRATAESIYGAQYALESFTQLVSSADATLPGDVLTLRDAPQYAWRGLMLDAGRRFFPMPLVKNLLDTMSATKLNVLHLHVSDQCRFGVESKLYPNLTASLTGIHGGFYTQSDVVDMQAYAKGLGIRVVPEFDFPGHSRGYIPASYGADGVQFCEPTAPTRTQLYGDPSGKTYKVVHDLMKEMSALFEDDVFNIGCDETGVKGPCTQESTFAVERQLFTAIKTELKKTPEGWEEAYFDAQAATNDTIVNAWARHTAAEVTAVGRRAVESRALELALVHVRWCTCAGALARHLSVHVSRAHHK